MEKLENDRKLGSDIELEGGEEYDKEMRTRKITIKTGPDILRWGHSTKGTFTIKEAYELKEDQEHDRQAQVWKKNWKFRCWPKVAHFLWLVSKGRILNWDKL